MKNVNTWLCLACMICAIITSVLAFMQFNLVHVTAEMPKSERGYTIEAIAIQITVLEIVLAVFGIILAVVGVFGYLGIKGAAEGISVSTAKETAERIAGERMSEFIKNQAHQNMVPNNVQSQKIAPTVPINKNTPSETE